MSKKTVLGGVVLVIIVAGIIGALTLGGNKNGHSSTTSSDMSNMDMSGSNKSGSSNPVATDKVSISNFAFSPQTIKVRVGTKVTWTNKDSITHTVTADDTTNGPSSGNLGEGQTYSFTFKKAGTYHYICSIHTEMTGTVIVTE